MASSNPKTRSIVATLGAATRWGTASPEALANMQRDLAAERLALYIERVVADAPPLTGAQRDRLAALLSGAVVPA
ncbi:hypothetical protein E3O46_06985 [Cryobacterium glucosi]|uniref:PhiRv1 phage protein n=1 Tax=Cryobacterium glucosi TaxID=1259175 RepID=A0ABY2INQ8_9MICO|nr:hypothetical protein E3O46_06985 [Cryobacterium glucosi]